MTNAQHAEGPWIVTESFLHNTLILVYNIVALNEHWIASTGYRDDEPQRLANARLIAAAPEMLDALKWQEMAEHDPEAARRKGYFKFARHLRRAAIAKATKQGDQL